MAELRRAPAERARKQRWSHDRQVRHVGDVWLSAFNYAPPDTFYGQFEGGDDTQSFDRYWQQ